MSSLSQIPIFRKSTSMSNLYLSDKVSFATILEDCFSEMNNKWDTSAPSRSAGIREILLNNLLIAACATKRDIFLIKLHIAICLIHTEFHD